MLTSFFGMLTVYGSILLVSQLLYLKEKRVRQS